jgi:transposase-like protein
MRGDPTTICIALDLYFKGLSYRKITHHLRTFYGIRVSKSTIHEWLRKYVNLLGVYLNQLKPHVSSKWHADEMQLKTNGKKWPAWNVMDSRTRFILASSVPKKRGCTAASRIIEAAIHRASKSPRRLITDGNQAYCSALDKIADKSKRITHIRCPKFGGSGSNNPIERLHGTIRERNKIQRGLRNVKSADWFVKSFAMYYNFLRPHMTLDERTPAEAAGLKILPSSNQWGALIAEATKRRRRSKKARLHGHQQRSRKMREAD